MFAKIDENNKIIEWPIASLTTIFPNTSFPIPLTQADLPEGYVIVETTYPPETNINQKAIPAAPILQDEKWIQSWDIVDLTTEELAKRIEGIAQDARMTRNQLLADSDWTQVADAPVDKTAWAAYRQALRDITNQSGFPLNIIWPEKPSNI